MKPTIKFKAAYIIVAITMFVFLSLPTFLVAQQRQIDCIPKQLPSNLILREPKPIKYQIITDYFNQDIVGNFFNKSRVTAQYTRGLSNGNVQWNDVRVAETDKKDEPFTEGARQGYMENFSYNPVQDITDTSLYKAFPKTNIFGKTLVLDMFTFESFAWLCFDSLHLNVPYHARTYDSTVLLGEGAYFINKDVILTWTGISKMNGRQCFLIQFEAMGNPLSVRAPNMDSRGRSHYWGDIWVALDDKQLEAARMNEDVMLEATIQGSGKQYINAIRKITVKKYYKY